ncbi:hypothetical protein OIU34_00030 [Pararhizobium sp. BT-229]|uniref:hypothetical protein n=1 Tax=Pararhizobium sp. BT-229 TaxID=2986923 RepID=UPI0021F6CE5A|nr:hypothetical protein [Pararhizobium sp. BT-229]MCV9960275.1 hypothetical protein [Pararhizobium sp. BT-229]
MSKASQAIIDLLRRIEAVPEKPINMFEIGIPLIIGEGGGEDEIMNALFWLQSEGVIELLGDNRLRLVKPLPSGSDTYR